jgi:hypothetical protein
MRRFFLCFLLCLMPLRLWAGAWMPMAESSAHAVPTPTHTMAVDHAVTEVNAAHDCHQVDGAPVMATTAAMPEADCHDASCQLCGVCHQSAGLAVWPAVLPVVQSYALPVGESHQPAGLAFSPPIKPPIS